MTYKYKCGNDIINVFVWSDDFHTDVAIYDKETAFWLEDLTFTSYLSLEEIQNFDWDKEVYYFEEDCKHSEIACEFYTEVSPL